MIRTTTPTHILKFPFDPADCDEILVTYKQNDRIVVEREKPDVTINSEEHTIEYTLTQQETKSFSALGIVYLQVKCRQNETVMASDMKTLKVEQVLNDDLMGVNNGQT